MENMSLSLSLIHDLAILLNPEHNVTSDWRLMADKLGFTNDDILNFAREKSPTKEVITAYKGKSGKSPHEILRDILLCASEIKRKDVVSLIEEWQRTNVTVYDRNVPLLAQYEHNIRDNQPGPSVMVNLQVTDGCVQIGDNNLAVSPLSSNGFPVPGAAPQQEDKGNMVLKAVVDNVSRSYKRDLSTMKPVDWMDDCQVYFDDIYTNLKLVHGFRNERRVDHQCHQDKSEVHIQIQYLFTRTANCSRPSRILIEGKPGVGKSTLSKKIVYNWAKLQRNIQDRESNDLTPCFVGRDFKIVFFIELKHVDGSLKHEILKVFDDDFEDVHNISDETVWKFVQKNQEQTLFVLDGYDELPDEINPDIDKLLTGKILSKASVILTTRPHEADKIKKTFDSLVKIYGYTPEKMKEFVGKYYDTMEYPPSPNKIKKLLFRIDKDDIIRDLGCNPLNLQFLCLLTESDDDIPLKRADLYKKLVEAIIYRYCVKHNIPVDASESSDNFEVPVKIQNMTNILERISYHGILNNKIMFPLKDIPQAEGDIANLGFFSKDRRSRNLRGTQSFCFFAHKTIQEYFAARYFVFQIRNDEKRKLYQRLTQDPSLEMMCVFVCGIMKMDSDNLMLLFKSFFNSQESEESLCQSLHVKYSHCFECLQEVAFTNELVNVVAKSMSDSISLNYAACPVDVLKDFIRVMPQSNVNTLELHLDGVESDKLEHRELAIALASAIKQTQNLTVLKIYQHFLLDTGFFVDFLATAFEDNHHISDITLGGQMNRSTDLTEDQLRRIRNIFESDNTSLKHLCIENVHNHKRLKYILDCWPDIFESLTLRQCTLESATDAILHKIVHQHNFKRLDLDHVTCLNNLSLGSILNTCQSKSSIENVTLNSVCSGKGISHPSNCLCTKVKEMENTYRKLHVVPCILNRLICVTTVRQSNECI